MTAYVACRNCGTYVAAGQATARRYCSKDCTRAYEVCLNCGNYFPKGEGIDAEHCSKACTIRYVILRKYGPEPVLIVAEEV